MSLDYTIKYFTKNTYDNAAAGAVWQFLIIPEENSEQELIFSNFKNSINARVEESINGFGFKTYRVSTKHTFESIEFEADFRVNKSLKNVFQNINTLPNPQDFQLLKSLEFRVEHHNFLSHTALTVLSEKNKNNFNFDPNLSVFNNILNLNAWVFKNFNFKTNVTHVKSNLDDIIENKHGVCQDFTHLFCAIARENAIPTRYISGYLHQGNGYFGDSQMHAWAECFIPGSGWIGFDPTNNILAAENHIKVAHGRDYTDCPPIKGVVYANGTNTTTYKVAVSSQQQQ